MESKHGGLGDVIFSFRFCFRGVYIQWDRFLYIGEFATFSPKITTLLDAVGFVVASCTAPGAQCHVKEEK